MKKVEGRDLRQILLDPRHEVRDVMEDFPCPASWISSFKCARPLPMPMTSESFTGISNRQT